eukprot:m.17700 g.17700  ORF g.17700 m.17700 type:complete len:1745 (+) comp7186_c0_seq1:583-5817(+)
MRRNRRARVPEKGDWPLWEDKDAEPDRLNVFDVNRAKLLAKPKLDEELRLMLPPSLQGRAVRAVRALDGFAQSGFAVKGRDDEHVHGPAVVSPLRSERVRAEDYVTDTETKFMRMRNLRLASRMREFEVSLTLYNDHLLCSETMRWIMAALSYLQREPETHDAHTMRPWALVYPQQGGMPQYTSSGRYFIKLFWMGAWRRVTVDDNMPVDEDGRFLLPRSTLHELWPLLVAKAVCRVLEPYYEVRLDLPEFGQASVLQLLTGWLPETRALDMVLPDTVRRDASASNSSVAGVAPPSIYPSNADEEEEEVPLTPHPDAIQIIEPGHESPPPSAPATPALSVPRPASLTLPPGAVTEQENSWQRAMRLVSTTDGRLATPPAQHTSSVSSFHSPLRVGPALPTHDAAITVSLDPQPRPPSPSRQQSLFGQPPTGLMTPGGSRSASVMGQPPNMASFHPSDRDKPSDSESSALSGLEALLQQLRTLCFAPSSSPILTADPPPSSSSPPSATSRNPPGTISPDRESKDMIGKGDAKNEGKGEGKGEGRERDKADRVVEKAERPERERERVPPPSAARKVVNDDKSRRGLGGGGASIASARPKTTLNAGPPPPPDPPAQCARNTMVLAYYHRFAPPSNSDVGLPGRLSHPVKVLSCLPAHQSAIKRLDASDCSNILDDWVLELESPLVLFSGILGYHNYRDYPNLSKLQLSLQTSFEREQHYQELILTKRAAREPHPAFRFRMLFRHFVQYFSHVSIMHKESLFANRVVLNGTTEGGLQVSSPQTREQMRSSFPAEPSESPLEPLLLYAFSPSRPMQLLVSLSVATPIPLSPSPLAPTPGLTPAVSASAVTLVAPTAALTLPRPMGSSVTTPPSDDSVKLASIIFEEFDWRSPRLGKVLLQVSTTGTHAVTLTLPAGRNALRIQLCSALPCSLSIFSNTDFTVSDELSVVRNLGGNSSRIASHAVAVVRSLRAAINAPPATRGQLLHDVIRTHTNVPGMLAAMPLFWSIVNTSLATVFETRWAQPALQGLTFGEAWLALVRDLQRQFARLSVVVVEVPQPSYRLSRGRSIRRRRMTYEQATIKIQARIRGYLARRLVTRMRVSWLDALHAVCAPIDALFATRAEEVGLLVLRKLIVAAPALAPHFPWVRDERLQCAVRELQGQLEIKHHHDHSVMFLDTLWVTERTTINARLLLPGQLADDENPIACSLRIVNNDTSEELPSVFTVPQPVELAPNLYGYSLVATAYAMHPVPQTTFNLRILSNPELPAACLAPQSAPSTATPASSSGGPASSPVVATSVFPPVPCAEFTGTLPAKPLELFRFTVMPSTLVQPVSLVLLAQQSMPDLTLTVVLRGSIVHRQCGRGRAVIPLAVLHTQLDVYDPADRAYTIIGYSKPWDETESGMDNGSATRTLSAGTTPPPPPAYVGGLQLPNAAGAAVGHLAPPGTVVHRVAVKVGKKAKATFAWVFRAYSKESLHIHMDSARDEEILAMKRAWAAAAPMWELARPRCVTDRVSVTLNNSPLGSELRDMGINAAQMRRVRGDASRQLYLANPTSWPDGLRAIPRPPVNHSSRESVQTQAGRRSTVSRRGLAQNSPSPQHVPPVVPPPPPPSACLAAATRLPAAAQRPAHTRTIASLPHRVVTPRPVGIIPLKPTRRHDHHHSQHMHVHAHDSVTLPNPRLSTVVAAADPNAPSSLLNSPVTEIESPSPVAPAPDSRSSPNTMLCPNFTDITIEEASAAPSPSPHPEYNSS